MISQLRKNIEPIFWIAGLVFLALQNPSSTFASMCLFDILGLYDCPGCGMGTAISYLFDGQVIQSIQTHYLGIPVVLAIVIRVYQIAKLRVNKIQQKSLRLG
jgi:hypothetical protein